ncbi:hypothetical protein HDZ31DRAFT_63808 [Schizophyllum fasciatum]
MPGQPAIAAIPQRDGEDSDSGLSSLADSDSEYELDDERAPTPPPPPPPPAKKRAAPRKSAEQAGARGTAGKGAAGEQASARPAQATAGAPLKEECADVPAAAAKESPKAKRTRASTTQATATSRAKSTKNVKKTIVPMFDRKRRTENMSVADIYKLVSRGRINLNAEYQRDVVWTQDKQSSLIDSIMHNIHIPPLIFSMKDGSDDMICMDGKQRITSIQRFMDGEIPLKDSRSGKRYWYCGNPKTKTSTRLQIDEDSKERFERTQIVLVYYDNISVQQEREIFGRVQNGVALTPAERMRAINTDAADVVRAAEAHIVSTLAAPAISAFMHADGERFYTLAQIAMLVLNPKADVPDTTRTERWLNTGAVGRALVFYRALNVLLVLALMEEGQGQGQGHGAPPPSAAELVMAGYLAHQWREQPLAQVVAGVRALWAEARAAHTGPKGRVRLTEAVYKKMKAFARAGPGGLGVAMRRGAERVSAAVPGEMVGLEVLVGLVGGGEVVPGAAAREHAAAPVPPEVSTGKRKEGPRPEGERAAKRVSVAEAPVPDGLIPLGRKRKNEAEEATRPGKKTRANEVGASEAPPTEARSAVASSTLKATSSCQQAGSTTAKTPGQQSASLGQQAASSTQAAAAAPAALRTQPPAQANGQAAATSLSKAVAAKNSKTSRAATAVKPRKSSGNTSMLGQAGASPASSMATNQASASVGQGTVARASSAWAEKTGSPYQAASTPLSSLPRIPKFSASAPQDNVLTPSLARMSRGSANGAGSESSSAPTAPPAHVPSAAVPPAAESSLPTPPSTTSSLPPVRVSMFPNPDISLRLPRPPLPSRAGRGGGRGGRGRLMDDLHSKFGAHAEPPPPPSGANPSLLGWHASPAVRNATSSGGGLSPLSVSSPGLGVGPSGLGSNGDRRTTDPRMRGSAASSPVVPSPVLP